MTEFELLLTLKNRIQDPLLRVDLKGESPPRLFATATGEELARTEESLGFRLPELLRRIFCEVGNGGFGPGTGMIGVYGGYQDEEGRTLADTYAFFASAVETWPERLVPLWDWEGNIWSCLDCSGSGGGVVTLDESGFTRTRFTLLSWLESWVSGVSLFDEIYSLKEGTIINPFTKQPMTVKIPGGAKPS